MGLHEQILDGRPTEAKLHGASEAEVPAERRPTSSPANSPPSNRIAPTWKGPSCRTFTLS